jgi:predicted O-methyltransferase YrrM
LTDAERECLKKHAAGKKRLVEIGVMFGSSTALLKSAMDPTGKLVGVDPHRPGRFGVSFENLVARAELRRTPGGAVELLPKFSYEAAHLVTDAIDFLFIDGDHSWEGVERDWRDWSPKIAPGGIVALHHSRSVAFRPDLDSVRFQREVVAHDPRFREIDAADSLTVMQKSA